MEAQVSPEAAAAAWLARLGLDSGEPPIDVDDLAEERAGLDVQEHSDLRSLVGSPGGPLSGLLLPASDRIYVDAVEAQRSPGRRRFTIAHELGHWYLHRAGGDARFCRSEDVGGSAAELRAARRIEAEANRFAAALLMPESLVRRDAPACRYSVPALARRFGVSVAAMQVRLEALQLLPNYMRL